MTYEVLYTSEAVRQAIREVLGAKTGRRVAVAAFVGRGAEAYIPAAKGVELYCWPAVPGTNPDALAHLQGRLGVEVYLVERLHMKVYWSASRGAVITSANLSSNALGHGDLREAGIRLPRGAVDIARLLKPLKKMRLTAQKLTQLRAAYRKEREKNPARSSGRNEQLTFAEWYKGRPREPWKLAPYYGGMASSQAIRQYARTEGGKRDVENWVSTRRDELAQNDYVLCVDVSDERVAKTPEWLFVSKIVHVATTDPAYERGFPYQAGQLDPLKFYRRPPFRIDAQFRRALRQVSVDLGTDGVAKYFDWHVNGPPKPTLLRRLNEAFLAEGAV
jgi:hypothetical protein